MDYNPSNKWVGKDLPNCLIGYSGIYHATIWYKILCETFASKYPTGRHWYKFKSYNNCFAANEAITWLGKLLKTDEFKANLTRQQTINILRIMHNLHQVFEDVRGPQFDNEQVLDNSRLFRFKQFKVIDPVEITGNPLTFQFESPKIINKMDQDPNILNSNTLLNKFQTSGNNGECNIEKTINRQPKCLNSNHLDFSSTDMISLSSRSKPSTSISFLDLNGTSNETNNSKISNICENKSTISLTDINLHNYNLIDNVVYNPKRKKSIESFSINNYLSEKKSISMCDISVKSKSSESVKFKNQVQTFKQFLKKKTQSAENSTIFDFKNENLNNVNLSPNDSKSCLNFCNSNSRRRITQILFGSNRKQAKSDDGVNGQNEIGMDTNQNVENEKCEADLSILIGQLERMADNDEANWSITLDKEICLEFATNFNNNDNEVTKNGNCIDVLGFNHLNKDKNIEQNLLPKKNKDSLDLDDHNVNIFEPNISDFKISSIDIYNNSMLKEVSKSKQFTKEPHDKLLNKTLDSNTFHSPLSSVFCIPNIDKINSIEYFKKQNKFDQFELVNKYFSPSIQIDLVQEKINVNCFGVDKNKNQFTPLDRSKNVTNIDSHNIQMPKKVTVENSIEPSEINSLRLEKNCVELNLRNYKDLHNCNDNKLNLLNEGFRNDNIGDATKFLPKKIVHNNQNVYDITKCLAKVSSKDQYKKCNKENIFDKLKNFESNEFYGSNSINKNYNIYENNSKLFYVNHGFDNGGALRTSIKNGETSNNLNVRINNMNMFNEMSDNVISNIKRKEKQNNIKVRNEKYCNGYIIKSHAEESLTKNKYIHKSSNKKSNDVYSANKIEFKNIVDSSNFIDPIIRDKNSEFTNGSYGALKYINKKKLKENYKCFEFEDLIYENLRGEANNDFCKKYLIERLNELVGVKMTNHLMQSRSIDSSNFQKNIHSNLCEKFGAFPETIIELMDELVSTSLMKNPDMKELLEMLCSWFSQSRVRIIPEDFYSLIISMIDSFILEEEQNKMEIISNSSLRVHDQHPFTLGPDTLYHIVTPLCIPSETPCSHSSENQNSNARKKHIFGKVDDSTNLKVNIENIYLKKEFLNNSFGVDFKSGNTSELPFSSNNSLSKFNETAKTCYYSANRKNSLYNSNYSLHNYSKNNSLNNNNNFFKNSSLDIFSKDNTSLNVYPTSNLSFSDIYGGSYDDYFSLDHPFLRQKLIKSISLLVLNMKPVAKLTFIEFFQFSTVFVNSEHRYFNKLSKIDKLTSNFCKTDDLNKDSKKKIWIFKFILENFVELLTISNVFELEYKMCIKTFCKPLSEKEYEIETKFETNRALTQLLDNIISDRKLTEKSRKNKLKQFELFHPHIFYERFSPSTPIPFPTVQNKMSTIKSIFFRKRNLRL